jgi:hypothetical protein
MSCHLRIDDTPIKGPIRRGCSVKASAVLGGHTRTVRGIVGGIVCRIVGGIVRGIRQIVFKRLYGYGFAPGGQLSLRLPLGATGGLIPLLLHTGKLFLSFLK